MFVEDSPPPSAPKDGVYTYTFQAVGNSVSYSLAAGTLPAGLTLSPAGVLTGKPTETGSFSFTVLATSDGGLTAESSSHTLRVVADPVTGGGAGGNGNGGATANPTHGKAGDLAATGVDGLPWIAGSILLNHTTRKPQIACCRGVGNPIGFLTPLQHSPQEERAPGGRLYWIGRSGRWSVMLLTGTNVSAEAGIWKEWDLWGS